jgi:hypothetical protein
VGRVALSVGAMVALVFPVAAFASAPAVLESHAVLALVVLSFLGLSSYTAALWLLARRLLLVHLALARRSLLRPLRRLGVSLLASAPRPLRGASS